MEAIYNLDRLIAITVRDFERCNYYEYRPFRKSFWGNQKEGFYESFFGYTDEADLPQYLRRNGNTLYYRPNVKLIFDGDVECNKAFETLEYAIKWAQDIANKANINQLIIE